MDRKAFLQQEREALERFMRRYPDDLRTFGVKDDPKSKSRYSCTYRCDCGFTTASAGEIYDHTCLKKLPSSTT